MIICDHWHIYIYVCVIWMYVITNGNSSNYMITTYIYVCVHRIMTNFCNYLHWLICIYLYSMINCYQIYLCIHIWYLYSLFLMPLSYTRKRTGRLTPVLDISVAWGQSHQGEAPSHGVFNGMKNGIPSDKYGKKSEFKQQTEGFHGISSWFMIWMGYGDILHDITMRNGDITIKNGGLSNLES